MILLHLTPDSDVASRSRSGHRGFALFDRAFDRFSFADLLIAWVVPKASGCANPAVCFQALWATIDRFVSGRAERTVCSRACLAQHART